jgi:ABC-type nickel/cobalt efflux system permease component RcnA
MDTPTVAALAGTAAFFGSAHTLLGPDHYLPFVAMSRAGKWSYRKTAIITFVCGLGHVLGSVILGLLGVALVWQVSSLEAFEGVRGTLAGWLLTGFGLAYLIWGIWRAIRRKGGGHVHILPGGHARFHRHEHEGEHVHTEGDAAGAAASTGEGEAIRNQRTMTPWILFVIFVFGPCEPLIPILMYPAAEHHWGALTLITSIFGVTTIATMLICVTIGYFGLGWIRLGPVARYSHALAGFVILLCGLAIQFGL